MSAYQKYLQNLATASNNASNLQNLVNEDYEETKQSIEAKAKIGEDVIEGVLGFEAIKGLKNVYQKFRKARKLKNKGEEPDNEDDDGGVNDDDLDDTENDPIDSNDIPVEDEVGGEASADADIGNFGLDVGTDDLPQTLGDLLGDDYSDLPGQTFMNPAFEGMEQDVTADISSGIGGIDVPFGAYGQVQEARDNLADVLTGNADTTETAGEYEAPTISEETADMGAETGEDATEDITTADHPSDIMSSDWDDILQQRREATAQTTEPAEEGTTGTEASVDATPVEEDVGEDVGKDVGETIGEDLTEDLTAGSLLGPVGEAGAVVYGIYQTFKELFKLGDVHKAVLPVQAGISVSPDSNLPTTSQI